MSAISSLGATLYRTVTTYPLSTVGGVAATAFAVGLTWNRLSRREAFPSKSKEVTSRQIFQDLRGAPRPQWFADRLPEQFAPQLTEEQQRWLIALFTPSAWGDLRQALSSRPLSEQGQREIEEIEAARGPSRPLCYLIGELSQPLDFLYPLLHLFGSRLSAERLCFLARSEVLPGARALLEMLEGEQDPYNNKEWLSKLIGWMEVADGETLSETITRWRCPEAIDTNWAEPTSCDIQIGWRRHQETRSSELFDRRGHYANFLYWLERNRPEIYAAWVAQDPDRRALPKDWWEYCTDLGTTFLGDLSQIYMPSIFDQHLIPIDFDPFEMAELLVRVHEAIKES